MEAFKKISDYPVVVNPLFTPERLAAYEPYIQKAIEQSRRMEIAAREWASKNFIQFHTR